MGIKLPHTGRILKRTGTASYIVYRDGDMYYAANGKTMSVEYSNRDATSVIQYAIDNSPECGTVFLKHAQYYINDEIKLRNGISMIGEYAEILPNSDFQGEAIIDIRDAPPYPPGRKQIIEGLYINAKGIAKYGIITRWNTCVGYYKISRNVIRNATESGIRLEKCGVTNIVNNTILLGTIGKKGIDLDHSGDNFISYNDIFGGAWGILAISGGNQILVGNNIYMQYVDLSLESGKLRSGTGIQLHIWQFPVVLIGNRIDNTVRAIALTDGKEVSLIGTYMNRIGYNYYTKDEPDPNATFVIYISGNSIQAIISDTIIGMFGSSYNTARKVLYADAFKYLSIKNLIINSIGSDYWDDIRVFDIYAVASGILEMDGIYYHEPRTLTKTVYGLLLHGPANIVAYIGKHNLPNVVIGNNVKFTKNKGRATIRAGSTRVTVLHNLVSAPSEILLTPYGNIKVWVENVTDTSFDIVTDTAPTVDVQVAWYAEV